jgi:hypothetical protein
MDFTCPTCQAELSVPDESAGQTEACPGCGAMLTIPARATSPRACPSCGVSVAGDAVLCISCGFDFRSGQTIQSAANGFTDAPPYRPSALEIVGRAVCYAVYAFVVSVVFILIPPTKIVGAVGLLGSALVLVIGFLSAIKNLVSPPPCASPEKTVRSFLRSFSKWPISHTVPYACLTPLLQQSFGGKPSGFWSKWQRECKMARFDLIDGMTYTIEISERGAGQALAAIHWPANNGGPSEWDLDAEWPLVEHDGKWYLAGLEMRESSHQLPS